MTRPHMLYVRCVSTLGDLIAWAQEPAHCNGNKDVAKWLSVLAASKPAFPLITQIPVALKRDVVELCEDWRELLESGGEDTSAFNTYPQP